MFGVLVVYCRRLLSLFGVMCFLWSLLLCVHVALPVVGGGVVCCWCLVFGVVVWLLLYVVRWCLLFAVC